MFFFASLLSLSLLPTFSFSQQVPPNSLALAYSLTTSTSFPFPSATQSPQDTQSFIVSNWSLGKGRIQDGAENIAFVNDPFPNKPPSSPVPESPFTGPVLQVTYPQGSFSHETGGTQFYNLWNTSDGASFGSMMISYEVAFDNGFDWVKGGKLPGLRGGLDPTGCSGGNKADGEACFSTRLMWRKGGSGEIYAYIPSPNGLCDVKNIICNTDFGISMSRGSFGFITGQWSRITLLIQLNNPPNIANGLVRLYFNDLLATEQTGLQFRSSASLAADGMYFSTFFGGSDPSWATPNLTHTYYRNLHMWGGSSPSNLTGEVVESGVSRTMTSHLGLFSVLAPILYFWVF
ncbi:polysaccharide lyase family 14 protein [Amanita thiersii Skay4041]|uniref:Polysaccharide lyase family 14 protein n=1 Tax=Amanita thiersii Skay4041 TaxID=703135 RepID=A0A2A9NKI7_9AGAR|nr:polysaccharide lyase family 14 protein [Amanita thiersii Skay4041]